MDGWKAGNNDTAAFAAGRQGNGHGANAHHATAPPSGAQGSAFTFQRRRIPINWRHLAGLDVDRVCREVDIQALQQNISNVTFCDVGSEDFQGVDGNFIKLFRLAQLTVEYLLHSQHYLSDQKNQLEQQVQHLQKELEVCQGEARAKIEEIKTLKRENRKRRKMIEAYQDMLNHGATGLHPCPVCSKEFVSQQYLDSHMHRRHPDHLQPKAAPKQGPTQEEIEKKLMEQMNEKFHTAQLQLREELTRKENESLRTQALEFEQWKLAQQEKRKNEQEEMQTPLQQQLRAVEHEKEQLQRVLMKTQAEIEAMKTLTQSLHSENQEPSSKTKPQETAPETAAPTAATDVKRLETKVVSKWKKHKKSVHKQMEEMNKSYQDQLIELSKKLASMEQSARAQQSLSPDKKQAQKDKMQTHTKTPPKQQQHNLTPVESQSEVSESTEEEEESEGESESEGGREETDTPHFTPFPNRSSVTTLFNHGQEAMQKIKRETNSILDNALQQRGVSKGMVGLSDALLESKLKLLEAERQQRVQMHYQFWEQRQRLASEVELSAKANCHFMPPRDLFPSSPPPPSSPSPRRSSPRRATSSPKTSPHQKTPPQLSSPRKGSTQRGSPTRQQESQGSSPGASGQQSSHSRVNSKPPTGLPAQTQLGRSLPKSGSSRPHLSRELQLQSSGSETETESGSESESFDEDNNPPMANAVSVLPASARKDGGEKGKAKKRETSGQPRAKAAAGGVRVLPENSQRWSKGGGREERGGGRELAGEEASSWDSDDSNGHLTTQDLMSVPTSTPVQVMPVRKVKVYRSDHDKDPPKLEESSDNSWDVTEISSESHPNSKRTMSGPPQDRHVVKLASTHSGNSQSALTTVSRGDFDDSDLSDISTTHLT